MKILFKKVLKSGHFGAFERWNFKINEQTFRGTWKFFIRGVVHIWGPPKFLRAPQTHLETMVLPPNGNNQGTSQQQRGLDVTDRWQAPHWADLCPKTNGMGYRKDAQRCRAPCWGTIHLSNCARLMRKHCASIANLGGPWVYTCKYGPYVGCGILSKDERILHGCLTHAHGHNYMGLNKAEMTRSGPAVKPK